MNKWLILAVLLAVLPAYNVVGGSQFGFGQIISSEDLDNRYRTIFLTDTWRYSPGDNTDWANPDFDDFYWDEVSTLLGAGDLPFIDWVGHGWFRLTMEVDESLVAIPLSLDIVTQSGASEFYHNGVLLYSFGTVTTNPDLEITYQERRPRTVIFDRPGTHVFAVRYSNHRAQQFVESGFSAGFRYLLVEMNHQVETVFDSVRAFTIQQFFFTGILMVFTIIHAFLFVFYPRQFQNLYFALFTGFFGLLYYLDYQLLFSTSGHNIMSIIAIRGYLIILTMIFFMLFCYALFYTKLPRQFWGFLVGLSFLGILTKAGYADLVDSLVFVMMGLFVLEIFRILFVAVYQRKKGAWIISSGMLIFVVCQVFTILVNMKLVETETEFAGQLSGVIGIISLLITMSVSLSRSFAETHNRLETKLREVQQLSMQAIEQEREQKSREIERRLLEADNSRKTNELEDARRLQLSMLPGKLPQSDFTEIAVRMRTATEVGGDYYDFALTPNKEIIVALGDATGHGVKAGIVVATAKSYFNTFASDRSLTQLLKVISAGIKNMNLRMIYMTMVVARLNPREICISGAGMPPVLLYRSQTEDIEILTSKGMPMGSVQEYPYQEISRGLQRGDVILMLSDGLIEAFGPNREQFGLERTLSAFQIAARQTPDKILDHLETEVQRWTANTELEDDYTLVAIKITS